jgi:deoxyribonuclease-4
VNLAGTDGSSFDKSIALLSQELHGAASFGARFVNVHIGSHRGAGIEAGIDRLVDGVARTLVAANALRAGDVVRSPPELPSSTDSRPVLVLENSAGSGGGFGSSVSELAAIARALDARGVAARDVAFCIDAAHAWGAGIDMSDPDAIDDFVAAFDDQIGLSRLVMVHLNDSRSERGSKTDRHEHLGAGRIGAAGLGHLLRHPRLGHAAYLIETPGMDVGYDATNLARARALALGLPLEPLPQEAFELRGSSKARTAPA